VLALLVSVETTLAMFAHAFLIVAALTERTRHPSPSGLIGLTCNELQPLFAALVARATGDLDHRVRWSCGDADIKCGPGAATTADKPPSNHEDQPSGWSARRQRSY